MDSNLTQRRRGLEEKIPDIKKTLSMVEFLRDRRVRPMLPPYLFLSLFFFSLYQTSVLTRILGREKSSDGVGRG